MQTAGETCDDGNLTNGDGCDVNCTPTGCGNGVTTAGEACDDANATSGDGCTACAIDTDFVCVGTPSSCAPVCGNGTTTAPETCDDSNTAVGDACDASCTSETDLAEGDPNNTIADADTQAGLGIVISGASTVISGAITPTLDRDFFKMPLATASVVHFETFDSSGSDCTAAAVAAAMKLTVVNDTACTTANQATTCAAVGATCNTVTSTCQIKVDSSTKGIGNCAALTLNMAAGTYYAIVEKNTSGTIAAYKLQVKIDTNRGNETEPNGTQATANGLAGSDVYVFGGHQLATDNDVFAIPVPAGKSIRAEIIEGNAETCESNEVDSRLRLFSPTFVDLGNVDDNGRGFCSLLDGTGVAASHGFAHNLAAGTYYLRVEASNPTSTTFPTRQVFDYRLVVTVR
ncbi:MAG: hypothetical protein U0414_33445 [Polyangiaceae bacterium]